MEANNYYETLDLKPGASQEEVYQAYHKSKNAYSEESLALYSLMSKDECDKILESIEEAYSILSEPNKRKEYDRVRGFSPANYAENYQLNKSDDEQTDKHTFDRYSAKNSAKANRLTAISKFSLDYQVDQDMETRIENAEEVSGSFLKQIREYKGVSLARLAEMSRISLANLERIENDRFDELPAMAYIRGFAFQIARCLKLNADQIAKGYMNYIRSMS